MGNDISILEMKAALIYSWTLSPSKRSQFDPTKYRPIGPARPLSELLDELLDQKRTQPPKDDPPPSSGLMFAFFKGVATELGKITVRILLDCRTRVHASRA